VTQLHQTIKRIAKMFDEYMARNEMQWLSMEVWLEDREKKWDDRNKDYTQWGMGIVDMNEEVLARATVREAAMAQRVRKEGKDKNASLDAGSLEE